VCVDPQDRREDGLPIGSECDPMAATNPCNGFCLNVGGGNGMCTGVCNISGFGCGADVSSSDPFESTCLLGVLDSGLADLGFCGQLCDCDDDCHHPDAVCDAFEADSLLAMATQRVGACSLEAGVEGTPCGGATSDAGPVTAGDGGS
jgi:hypothetical protein